MDTEPKPSQPIPKYIEQERNRVSRIFAELKKEYSNKIPEAGTQIKSKYSEIFFMKLLQGVNILITMNLIEGEIKTSCEEFQRSYGELKFNENENKLPTKQDVIKASKLLNKIIAELKK